MFSTIWHSRKGKNYKDVKTTSSFQRRGMRRCNKGFSRQWDSSVWYCNATGLPSASVLKNLPAMQETWACSLGWEDPLRRAQQPTSVFLPGESHGLRSLVGYHLQIARSRTWPKRLYMHTRGHCNALWYAFLKFCKTVAQIVSSGANYWF